MLCIKRFLLTYKSFPNDAKIILEALYVFAFEWNMDWKIIKHHSIRVVSSHTMVLFVIFLSTDKCRRPKSHVNFFSCHTTKPRDSFIAHNLLLKTLIAWMLVVCIIFCLFRLCWYFSGSVGIRKVEQFSIVVNFIMLSCGYSFLHTI